MQNAVERAREFLISSSYPFFDLSVDDREVKSCRKYLDLSGVF